jgi:hypothetical protein
MLNALQQDNRKRSLSTKTAPFSVLPVGFTVWINSSRDFDALPVQGWLASHLTGWATTGHIRE